MSEELSKVDSAVAGLSISPPKDSKDAQKKEKAHKRATSTSEGVRNINDLGRNRTSHCPRDTKARLETQYPPSSLDDKEVLKKLLTTPPVKRIDLHFPLGLEVTARNLKGVTIKDALDAIHKQFKKKADDELDNPILAGFEWDKEESWTRLIVHQKKQGAPVSSKKSKKKGGDE
ncbi:hypothetical protein BDFG_03889 [Blastomyces dermatitidis ATCC 26199]|nr:hypothetical protein BDFG_03889 [Blastomyces dermatitidis ATCC 26199]